MPDHIHGIVHIEKSDPKMPHSAAFSKNKFGPQSKNLGSILRGYKIGVTKKSKLICPKFKWQPRYHDHIIRDEAEYQRIHNYIIANPKNWGKPKQKKRL